MNTSPAKPSHPTPANTQAELNSSLAEPVHAPVPPKHPPPQTELNTRLMVSLAESEQTELNTSPVESAHPTKAELNIPLA